jgi:hypothetical protein
MNILLDFFQWISKQGHIEYNGTHMIETPLETKCDIL